MNDNNEEGRSNVTAFRPRSNMEVVSETAKPKDRGQRFEIHIADEARTVVTADGFLGVTPAFIAVASEEGVINFSLPSEFLIYVKSIGRVEDLDKGTSPAEV